MVTKRIEALKYCSSLEFTAAPFDGGPESNPTAVRVHPTNGKTSDHCDAYYKKISGVAGTSLSNPGCKLSTGEAHTECMRMWTVIEGKIKAFEDVVKEHRRLGKSTLLEPIGHVPDESPASVQPLSARQRGPARTTTS